LLAAAPEAGRLHHQPAMQGLLCCYHRQILSDPSCGNDSGPVALSSVAPTIVLTSLVLFLGYAVMTPGSLKTVQLFGLLTAIAVVGAFYGALVVFPLVLKKYDPE
jgi:predicted RND superfamily exporter protein